MTGWRRTVTLIAIRNVVHGLTAFTVAGLICLIIGQQLQLQPNFWLLQGFLLLVVFSWITLPMLLPKDALIGLSGIGLLLLGAWGGSIYSIHIDGTEWPLLVGMAIGLLAAWGIGKLYHRFDQHPIFTTSDPA